MTIPPEGSLLQQLDAVFDEPIPGTSHLPRESRTETQRRFVFALILATAKKHWLLILLAFLLAFVAVPTIGLLAADNIEKDDALRQKDTVISHIDSELNSLRTRLDNVQREIDELELLRPVIYDLRIADRDRIEVVGDFNPAYIQEIRVRWGTEKADTLYRGGPKPVQAGGRKEFFGSSEFRLAGDPIAVTLEFVPYPEIKERLPFFFRADQMQHSRNFLLARDGIKADPVVAEILTPKEGAKVQRFHEIEGKLHTKEGWPVVLVRGGNDIEWWVQPPVAEVEEGVFTVPAYFGSKNTAPGTKFRVVIVVAKNKEEAHNKYKPDTTLTALPSGLPRSKSISVSVTRE